MIKTKIFKLTGNLDALRYGVSSGAFGILAKVSDFSYYETCRELFRDSFHKNTTRIGWTKTNLNIKNINEFFSKIEKTLKVKKPTIFQPTQVKDFIVIEPSEFWRENETRRQFFTLFLRGSNYYKGDVVKAMSAYDLASRIEEPIKHFLAGNTVPNYADSEINGHGGLVDMYQAEGENFFKSKLVKKLHSKICNVEFFPLW